jgi:hypothetical protein
MTPQSKIPRNIKDTNLLRSMFHRRGMDLSTTSRHHKASAETIIAVADPKDGQPGQDHSNLSVPVRGKKKEIDLDDPDHPSTDLRKHARGLIRKIKQFPGKVRNLYTILRPPLTPDQAEKKEFERVEKARNALCMKEAKFYARQLSDKLAQLGERELLGSPDPNKPRKLKKCRWSMISRDELFTKIILRMNTNPRHLPSYVKVSELARNPLYADECLPTLGHFVKWTSDDWGVAVTVYRHGLDGLPEFVTTDELWKRCPQNKPPLTVAVGFGDNSSTHFIDPTQYPHLLISGGTGWGKSNMINQILCFWLSRGLKPNELQLILFDLKRGMEFSSYENLPHLYHDDYIKTGIIENLDGVLPTLSRMQDVRDKRMDQIKHAGFKNFQDYNRGVKSADRLSAIFLVFDEWAKIRLSRSGAGTYPVRGVRNFGLEAEDLLAEFTNLARAAGMFVILATQHPSREVLSGIIMINFPTRIILNSSVGGSLAALGTQSAFGMEVQGRAILLDRGQEIKLQTPMISPETIKAQVYRAITGKDLRYTDGIDLQQIFQYSLNNLDGFLDIVKLYEIFRIKKVRKDWLQKALREAESQEYIISGVKYKVSPRGNHLARQLIAMKE